MIFTFAALVSTVIVQALHLRWQSRELKACDRRQRLLQKVISALLHDDLVRAKELLAHELRGDA